MSDSRAHYIAFAGGCLFLGLGQPGAFAQSVENAVRFDISPQPLKNVQAPPKAEGAFRREHRVKPLPLPPQAEAVLTDTALQSAPANKLDVEFNPFPGIGKDSYSISADPPDTNGSVGRTHYVQWVNTGLAVYEKATRQRVLGPIDGNLVWSGFGGNCEQFNDGDPIALYDKLADRWILTQFAVSAAPFSECIAVSTSSDPTGTYARYEYQFKDFNDYPKFGVWPDGYYGTFNMFEGNNFLGSKACAFERSKMLKGEAARMQCFDLPDQGGVLPADVDGTIPPPARSPNYIANFGENTLNLWKFHVDWSNPTASALTGPISIKTAPFRVACRASPVGGECVKQPHTEQRLDTLSDRLMFRLAYRNFNDHETLLANHSVEAAGASGIRWYEVHDLSGVPKIYQQGTYAPNDGAFRWMGSIAMNKQEDILVGYSVSSSTIFPSIRFAGRTKNDPAGRLSTEMETNPGGGAQENPERWGDYASMSVDPMDDCTFWFSTQFIGSTGQFNWSTAIVPIRPKNCQ